MTVSGLDILHVLAPAPFGGLESVVRLLATGHAARGHHVSIAAIVDDDSHPFVLALREAGVPVTTIIARGRNYRAQRRAMAELLRVRRPDVLHSHGYLPDILHLGVARALGIPAVTTLHGFTSTDWKLRLYERLQCRAASRASAAVAVSHGIAERLRRAGTPESRLHLIPNAYAPAERGLRRDEARTQLGLDAQRTYVGWIGRLSHEKGPDVMVEAMSRLTHPDAVLVFIGDGTDRVALEERVRARGLGDRVRFLGVVPDAGLLVRAFDVLALSSRTEGTPMTILEAMAAETPIIATRVGGVPDVLTEHDALLVAPERPDLLASAIATALTDQDAARARATSALARLHSAYAVEPWLLHYEQLYTSLTSSPAHPS